MGLIANWPTRRPSRLHPVWSERTKPSGCQRHQHLLAPPPRVLPKLADGGRGAGVPAGAQGGAEARRRGRFQPALPGLRRRRVPRPRRHGGRRQGEAAARRGLRLPPHQRSSPQGRGLSAVLSISVVLLRGKNNVIWILL